VNFSKPYDISANDCTWPESLHARPAGRIKLSVIERPILIHIEKDSWTDQYRNINNACLG